MLKISLDFYWLEMLRIAARNDKGYGPATQVRWRQNSLSLVFGPEKSYSHNLSQIRWLQDANSPALSGKVGVKRAASVGGQQFAKVAWSNAIEIFSTFIILRWPRLESKFRVKGSQESYYFGSAMERNSLVFKCTSNHAHSSEILYDKKCFFEYITTSILTFWCYIRVTFRHNLYDNLS